MTRRTARLALTALCAALACGCVSVPREDAPPAPPPVETAPPAPQEAEAAPPAPPPPQAVYVPDPVAEELKSILMYYSLLSKLPANELRREYDSARNAFAANASDANRLRLALVLSLAANPSKDERRALDLLEPMTKDGRGQYTPLRGLALVVFSLVREQQKIGTSMQALREKLDALMSLEKSMTERTTVPGAKR